jgi:hypothetical protein
MHLHFYCVAIITGDEEKTRATNFRSFRLVTLSSMLAIDPFEPLGNDDCATKESSSKIRRLLGATTTTKMMMVLSLFVVVVLVVPSFFPRRRRHPMPPPRLVPLHHHHPPYHHHRYPQNCIIRLSLSSPFPTPDDGIIKKRGPTGSRFFCYIVDDFSAGCRRGGLLLRRRRPSWRFRRRRGSGICL